MSGWPGTGPVRAPRMSEGDVGSFYLDDRGDIWRLIAYCDRPTATLERVTIDGRPAVSTNRPAQVAGAVGAPIFHGYRRLTPDGPDTGASAAPASNQVKGTGLCDA